MTFKIESEHRFKHEVRVRVPTNGGHRVETMQATFRVLPINEAGSFDLATEEGTRGLLQKVIVCFDDVIGEDGKPADYCDDLRDQLLDISFVRAAVAQAYFEAVAGGPPRPRAASLSGSPEAA